MAKFFGIAIVATALILGSLGLFMLPVPQGSSVGVLMRPVESHGVLMQPKESAGVLMRPVESHGVLMQPKESAGVLMQPQQSAGVLMYPTSGKAGLIIWKPPTVRAGFIH